MPEHYPRVDSIRMGIELEGMGSFRLEFSPIAGGRAAAGHDLATARQLDKDKLKGLIILNFGQGGQPGFDLTMEAPADKRRRATAEFVSPPYVFGRSGIENMHKAIAQLVPVIRCPSLRPAERIPIPRTITLPVAGRTFAKAEAIDSIPEAIQMVAKYSSGGGASISSNLQSTIGVAVDKLMNDDARVRNKVLDLLIFDEGRKNICKALIKLAIMLSDFLQRPDRPLNEYGDKKYGIRLASLFYFIKLTAFSDSFKTTFHKIGLRKDYFGMNLKGYSSLVGCGVARHNVIEVILSGNQEQDGLGGLFDEDPLAGLNHDIVAAITAHPRHDTHSTTIWNLVKESFNIAAWGREGQSIQVLDEEKPPIANFFNGARLFTVIESREGFSPLSSLVIKVFKTESSRYTAADLVREVGPILH